MIKKIIKDGTWGEKIVLVECGICLKQREIPFSAATKKASIKNKHRCRSCSTIINNIGKKRSEQAKQNMRIVQRKLHNGGVRFNQSGGYKQIIVDGFHPRKSNRKGGNYVFEHILVVEKHLGRFLEKHELVHHIDKNKQNNNIENLYLFSGKDNKESYQLHNAAHQSLEHISIDLYKLGLVKFVDGKYEKSEELKNYLLQYESR